VFWWVFVVVVCDWTECWSGGECTGMDWCFHKYLGSCRPLVMSTKMMHPPIDRLSIHPSIHPSGYQKSVNNIGKHMVTTIRSSFPSEEVHVN
jgi:hypothetical protein